MNSTAKYQGSVRRKIQTKIGKQFNKEKIREEKATEECLHTTTMVKRLAIDNSIY